MDSDFGVNLERSPHGGVYPFRKHNEVKTFDLSWHEITSTEVELTKLMDYIGGKNVCLIPDGDDPKDCYLVKFTGQLRRKHTRLNRYDASLVLEEVI